MIFKEDKMLTIKISDGTEPLRRQQRENGKIHVIMVEFKRNCILEFFIKREVANMTLEEIKTKQEKQIYDRKSADIDAKALAVTIIAFANADGGDIAIGISDKTKRIDGTDYNVKNVNELLRASYDYCEPSIPVEIQKVPCVDVQGRDNHIIVMHIEPSMAVHANQADEAFLRVGDKSKKLTFEERTQLMYDKGERYFEDKSVPDATIDDIDMKMVQAYTNTIDYGKTPLEYLKENKGFVKVKNGKEIISAAAILLFGKNPQLYFPRARIRFIRFDGTEEKVGTEMNVIKDVIFEGTILKMIQDCIAYLDTQIKEKTYLGNDGLFVTEEEYPRFVRQEIIVNAVTHRSYNITGTEIQVKMFDDRIVVESPGKLPGLVRANNIRHTHFSRNPRIAEYLKAYKYVKEYGEGVDRMCTELESVGLQDPTYYVDAFILKTIIYNASAKNPAIQAQNPIIENENPAIQAKNPIIENENPAIQDQNPIIENKKISIVMMQHAIEKQSYNQSTQEKLMKIYNEIDAKQVFGAPEIQQILGCATTTSRDFMAKLRDMEVVEAVKGKGKGRYIFKASL
ncbi:MAG: putative DNA binding domain-containing protein [Clostridiaceae bacterium]|nr:putative DNA binding domain-containing protein [Clostridiaceae bacterium]